MKFLKKYRKFVILLIVLLVLAFIGTLIIASESQNNFREIVNLKRTSVETKDLQKLVIASGKVTSEEKITVYADSSGEVLDVRFSENDKVNKDAEVLVIKTIDQFGKEDEVVVLAPFTGTITKIYVQEKGQVMPGQTPLFEIANFDKLRVEAAVAEADINSVKTSHRSKLVVPALDDRELNGEVKFIGLAPIEQTLGNPNYKVEISLEQIPGDLKLGMSVDVEIVVAEKKDVLAINDSYVFTRNDDDYVKVFQQKDNGEVSIVDEKVELGFEGETEVEIISGVKEGTEVVLPTDELKNQRSNFSFFGG